MVLIPIQILVFAHVAGMLYPWTKLFFDFDFFRNIRGMKNDTSNIFPTEDFDEESIKSNKNIYC